MAHANTAPNVHIRVVFGPDEMVGPGKMELLERIGDTGSIAAAGREMRMSYKRAWQLVETLNQMFRDPLVRTSRGGAEHGGATLTEAGRRVLAEYRALEADAHAACRDRLDRLRSMLNDETNGP